MGLAAAVVIPAGYLLIISPRRCRAFLCLKLCTRRCPAEHAAADKLGGPDRESYPAQKTMDMIIARLG
jgi:hypothetical protein